MFDRFDDSLEDRHRKTLPSGAVDRKDINGHACSLPPVLAGDKKSNRFASLEPPKKSSKAAAEEDSDGLSDITVEKSPNSKAGPGDGSRKKTSSTTQRKARSYIDEVMHSGLFISLSNSCCGLGAHLPAQHRHQDLGHLCQSGLEEIEAHSGGSLQSGSYRMIRTFGRLILFLYICLNNVICNAVEPFDA